MTSPAVTALRARLAAQKSDRLAHKSAPVEPAHLAVASAPAPVPAPAAPVLPAGVNPEAFAKMPANVQAMILAQDQGQAVAVNPPEAAAGLVDSAEKSVEVALGRTPDEAPAKRKRTPKTAPVPVPALDLGPIVAVLKEINETLLVVAEAAAGAE